jgi:hypothetical protein
MSKPKILIQFDANENPSVFDSVVAIDAGVEHLISQANVNAENVVAMIHGAIFTRAPEDLHQTALFFGGNNVEATEQIVAAAKKAFFGPMQVSLMSDPNGCNTTAAAAVICAERHHEFDDGSVTILGGTGPVGQRIAEIIAYRCLESGSKTEIRVCSRTLANAQQICERLSARIQPDIFLPTRAADTAEALRAIADSSCVFAAGAAGVELLGPQWQELDRTPRVAVDLNAVPPAGIAGIEVTASGNQLGETICYGAIGVGGLKMKIHKQCINELFSSNDRSLEVNEIYEIGKALAR